MSTMTRSFSSPARLALARRLFRRHVPAMALGVVFLVWACARWVPTGEPETGRWLPWTAVGFLVLIALTRRRDRNRNEELLLRLPLSITELFAVRWLVYACLASVLLASLLVVAMRLEPALPLGLSWIAWWVGIAGYVVSWAATSTTTRAFVEPLWIRTDFGYLVLIYILVMKGGGDTNPLRVGLSVGSTLFFLAACGVLAWRTHYQVVSGEPPRQWIRWRSAWERHPASKWLEDPPHAFFFAPSLLIWIEGQSIKDLAMGLLWLLLLVAMIYFELAALKRGERRELGALIRRLALPGLFVLVVAVGLGFRLVAAIPRLDAEETRQWSRHAAGNFSSIQPHEYWAFSKFVLAVGVLVFGIYWLHTRIGRWRDQDGLMRRLPISPWGLSRQRMVELVGPCLLALGCTVLLEAAFFYTWLDLEWSALLRSLGIRTALATFCMLVYLSSRRGIGPRYVQWALVVGLLGVFVLFVGDSGTVERFLPFADGWWFLGTVSAVGWTLVVPMALRPRQWTS